MFSFTDISIYHKDLQEKKTSCTEAVSHYIKNIQDNRYLNAFIEVYTNEAIHKAEMLDQSRKDGKPLKRLHGVIVAIKDVICYKDHQVTASSKMLNGFTSLYNATAIQRLLDEDAIIIGSCGCDEFAMGSSNENSVYGPVLNAIDNTKVPGGSSGGSAVAVQAGLCMTSLGSDTGGSVRQPADFCGIVGLKPSYGRISRHGLIAYASSFDQIGIFSHTISDAALMLDVMSGPDEFDSTALATPPPDLINHFQSLNSSIAKEKKYNIAVLRQAIDHPSLDKEIKNNITGLTESLLKEGHQVNEVDFDLIDYIVPAYYILTTAEASSNLARYDGIRYGHPSVNNSGELTDFYKQSRSEGFGKEVQRRIMLGTFVLSSGYYDAYYSKAQKVRKLLSDKTKALFDDYDAVIIPVSPSTAFTIGTKIDDPVAMYLADIFTVFANLTGIPAIALPLFKHSNGMPFGLQVMCKKTDELTLLQLAEELMQNHRALQP